MPTRHSILQLFELHSTYSRRASLKTYFLAAASIPGELLTLTSDANLRFEGVDLGAPRTADGLGERRAVAGDFSMVVSSESVSSGRTTPFFGGLLAFFERSASMRSAASSCGASCAPSPSEPGLLLMNALPRRRARSPTIDFFGGICKSACGGWTRQREVNQTTSQRSPVGGVHPALDIASIQRCPAILHTHTGAAKPSSFAHMLVWEGARFSLIWSCGHCASRDRPSPSTWPNIPKKDSPARTASV